MRRPADLLVLALAAGSLLAGGGVGCDPVAEGVDFRAASVLEDPDDKDGPRDYYQAITGKKAPGRLVAALPFAVTPPYVLAARLGVVDTTKLAASLGAEGCIGFRERDTLAEERVCVTTSAEPNGVEITSTLSAATATCAGRTRAHVELADGGTTLVARYRCTNSGAFTELASLASPWSEGAKWHPLFAASDVGPGGEVGLDEVALDSAGPYSDDPEAEPAFYAFEAFRLGVEGFQALEDGDLQEGVAAVDLAVGQILFAHSKLDPASPDHASANKLFAKAEKGHVKLLLKLASIFKTFPKLAAADAAALGAVDPGL